jgi:hypothetical protein
MRIGDTTWVGVEGTVLWPPSRTATTTAATTPATATTVTTTTTTAAKPAPAAKPPAVSDPFKGQKLSMLDPGDWTDGAACAPGDRAIDAILGMASARIQGDLDVGALRKGFAAAGATRAPDHKPERGWDEELWRFADGSGLLIARDNTDGVCKVWIKGPDGEQFDFDPAKDDLFHLPLTPDPRSAAQRTILRIAARTYRPAAAEAIVVDVRERLRARVVDPEIVIDSIRRQLLGRLGTDAGESGTRRWCR